MSPRPSTARALAGVAEERLRQVAQYGENDDVPYGTGWDARWLEPFSTNAATQIERLFRMDYERKGGNAGATWMRLLREELAEVAVETDPARLTAELTQLAALCVSWIERIERDNGGPAETSLESFLQPYRTAKADSPAAGGPAPEKRLHEPYDRSS